MLPETFSPELLRPLLALRDPKRKLTPRGEAFNTRIRQQAEAKAAASVAPFRIGLGDIRIRTKNKKIVPFVANTVQQRYLDDILPGWQGGDYRMQGLMEIILKARQFGFSTLIAALFFIDTINNPGTGTVVISNDKVNTKKLFEMVERMYRHLPEDRRPRTKRANTGEMYWPDLDCHYEVMTAGTKTSGRGWTINNLHCSESAFWTYQETLGGLLEAVPESGNIFLESTANGEGSEQQNLDGEVEIQGSPFHVFYERAKAGKSPFRANFFAWHENPEYRVAVPADFKRLDATFDETIEGQRYGNEERLAELYGLDDGQLAWRRRQIDKPGKGPAMFCQEYPANDVEAFRTSGKKFFAGVWDRDIHVRELEIKPWWTPIGGFDWGYGVPYSFGLGWVFPLGKNGHGIYVSDESYGARVENRKQAQNVIEILRRRGIKIGDITVYADPAMWGKEGKHQADNIGRANVEDFYDANLGFAKANNNREHGCANMRAYMLKPGALFVSPRCENLIRTLPLVLHDPHDLEVYEKSETCEQHAVDMLRYMLNSRPLSPDNPVDERPEEERYAETNQAFADHAHRLRLEGLGIKPEAEVDENGEPIEEQYVSRRSTPSGF